MKYLTGFLLTALVASATPTVSVDLINAGAPPIIDSSVTINGHTDNNVYIGPYTMKIGGDTVAALCIDFSDTSYLNTPYTANVTMVGSSNLSNTYWGSSYAQEYEEEAYIYSQIVKPGADRTGLQIAAWDITSYGITNSSYTNKISDNAYIDAALANYNSFPYSAYELVSDTSIHCEQEFLIDPRLATPEPGSILLLGAGLTSIGLFLKRRRKA